MKNIVAGALLVGLLVCGSSALAREGVYRIIDRDDCDADRIDSIVVYQGPSGEWRAALSSAEYGIRYQDHLLSWDGDFAIGGETTADSFDAAIFQGTFSLDYETLQGTVDAVSCPGPWSFTAEKVTPDGLDFALEPLADDTDLDFEGIYVTSSARNNGSLRVMALPSGRLVANFSVAPYGRISTFQEVRLFRDADVVEFFTVQDGQFLLKWSLSYGMRDGRLTLAGVGFTMNGRVYPVIAVKQ